MQKKKYSILQHKIHYHYESIQYYADSFAFILPDNLYFYKVYSKYIYSSLKTPPLREISYAEKDHIVLS